MQPSAVSRKALLRMVLVRFGAGFVGLCAVFFLPAGTLNYWQAWVWLAAIIMYAFTPLAAGSYWALIPDLLIIPVLVGRILNEEKVLTRELGGYVDYMLKTRFRLFPGLW